MTPKTKQEALRLIEALKAKIDELPDKARPVTEGWKTTVHDGAAHLMRYTSNTQSHGSYPVAGIRENGLEIRPHASHILDGIAHDDKGRIKVVGYVCAEDLKERFKKHHKGMFFSRDHVIRAIDKLAG